MANRFVLNERSYHGKGAVQEIAGEVKSRGLQKALVCTDPDLLKFGVTKKVTDVLDAAGIAYEIYDQIKPNPTIQNVQDGVEALKKSGADCIIAIGGGSSMDTSKAIGIIATNPEFADVRSLEGVAPTKNPCLPIIAVPTTAGTAAEVTALLYRTCRNIFNGKYCRLAAFQELLRLSFGLKAMCKFRLHLNEFS